MDDPKKVKEWDKHSVERIKALRIHLDSEDSGETPFLTQEVIDSIEQPFTGLPEIRGTMPMPPVHMRPFKSTQAPDSTVVVPSNQIQHFPFQATQVASGAGGPAFPIYPTNIPGYGSGGQASTPKPTLHMPIHTKQHAYTFLESAVKEMKDRAIQRDRRASDAAAGERSMASTVKAFNALTGKDLTEEEGWEFMILLKLVRGRQGDFRADDYTDAAAYSGLLGECASVRPRKT